MAGINFLATAPKTGSKFLNPMLENIFLLHIFKNAVKTKNSKFHACKVPIDRVQLQCHYHKFWPPCRDNSIFDILLRCHCKLAGNKIRSGANYIDSASR